MIKELTKFIWNEYIYYGYAIVPHKCESMSTTAKGYKEFNGIIPTLKT